jgi:hypothetical protein
VFNNDRDSNRVFVEGSETLAYAWNSCPVLGTDLSRSLLVTGREFKFPIDFVSQNTVNFEASDNNKKSFASDLTTLLAKCREIYTLLIGEHRAAHREYRNAQLNNPKQFQLHDVVFTNVQVQSRKTTHTVKKLAYIRRGPYKIVRSYPSGSYELQLLSNTKAATIKKHGSDLYLSPKKLIPHSPTHSSDQLFADTNKAMDSQPYKLAGLDGYNPAQPWKEPTAQAQLSKISQPAPQFPMLAELDKDYDGWPENTNPFVSKESSEPPKSPKEHKLVLTMAQAPTITTPQLIAAVVKSEDKLFFIAHAATTTAGRKEWKLVQVNFTKSIQQQPACLQNGRFLVDFYIEHHRNGALDIRDRRYWLEYHRSNAHKTISTG